MPRQGVGAFQQDAFQNDSFQVDITGNINLVTDAIVGWGGLGRGRPDTHVDVEHERFLARIALENRINSPREREVIAAVAARQVVDLHLDDSQRTEELYRELQALNLEMKTAHLRALNMIRERLIEQEIGQRLRMKMAEDDAMLLISLAAHLT